jgi:hypothetical protein
MSTEEEIVEFAEKLYQQFIENFRKKKKSPFLLLTLDDATFRCCPGITSANLRNVLLGGKSSGSASYNEFIAARATYEAPCVEFAMSMSWRPVFRHDSNNLDSMFQFTDSDSMSEKKIIDHLIMSTRIIITRIWSEEKIQKYIRDSGKDVPAGTLSKQVVRALFGVKRRQQIQLYKLNMPIHRRIALLNECIKVCNVMTQKKHDISDRYSCCITSISTFSG